MNDAIRVLQPLGVLGNMDVYGREIKTKIKRHIRNARCNRMTDFWQGSYGQLESLVASKAVTMEKLAEMAAEGGEIGSEWDEPVVIDREIGDNTQRIERRIPRPGPSPRARRT